MNYQAYNGEIRDRELESIAKSLNSIAISLKRANILKAYEMCNAIRQHANPNDLFNNLMDIATHEGGINFYQKETKA